MAGQSQLAQASHCAQEEERAFARPGPRVAQRCRVAAGGVRHTEASEGGAAWSRARAGVRALVDLVHCRALAAPTGLHKGRHNFRVDELYWFRFLPQGTDAYGGFSQGR